MDRSRSLGSGATSEDRAAMSGDYGALGCAGIEPDDAARWMIVQSEHETPVPITAHCEVPIERNALMPRVRSSRNDQNTGDDLGVTYSNSSGPGRAQEHQTKGQREDRHDTHWILGDAGIPRCGDIRTPLCELCFAAPRSPARTIPFDLTVRHQEEPFAPTRYDG